MVEIFSFNDWFLIPVYLIIIFLIGFFIKNKNITKNPEYKYFVTGLFLKIIGVSLFVLTYVFYYDGGDTVNYFIGTNAIGELIIYDFSNGFDVLFNNVNKESSWLYFKSTSIMPPYYMWKDPNTFSVCRFSVIFYFLGSKSFIITSFLTACFSYLGVWKLYVLVNKLYVGNSKILAYLILFLPTLIFWGSGIMKDSYVLGATCWITFNFHQIFIKRKKIIVNSIFLIFNLLIIINIKSYVLISLFPGMLLWINSAYLKGLNSRFSKIIFLPIFLIILLSVGFYTFNNLSSFMGVYGDVDTAIKKAQIIQDDLLREEQYGGNNYDLGTLDGSFSGLINVAPIAIFTALFRPLFWEIGSPTMVLSVIENTILLLFTFYCIVRIGPFKIYRTILKEPFLLYCFIFSLIFAFGVGIAGTNFGALVRYKIPLVPFFFSMIFLILKKNKIKNSS